MRPRLPGGSEDGGAAGVEFALWLIVLLGPLASVIDVSLYVHRRMQVEEAAQVAVQMVWETCDSAAKLPATDTTRCPLLNSPTNRIAAAVQSTSLGNAVTLGTVSEGYYCVNGSGALQLVATPPSTPPANCSSVGGSATAKPGDYVSVTVTYPYDPLFDGISLGAAMTTPIVRTATMRLG